MCARTTLYKYQQIFEVTLDWGQQIPSCPLQLQEGELFSFKIIFDWCTSSSWMCLHHTSQGRCFFCHRVLKSNWRLTNCKAFLILLSGEYYHLCWCDVMCSDSAWNMPIIKSTMIIAVCSRVYFWESHVTSTSCASCACRFTTGCTWALMT